MTDFKFLTFVFLFITLVMTSCSDEFAKTDDHLEIEKAHNFKELAKLEIAGDDKIENSYIVVFKSSFIKSVHDENLHSPTNRNDATTLHSNLKAQKINIAKELLFERNIDENQVKSYLTELLSGFVAELSNSQLKALLKDPRVDYIAEDRMIKLIETEEVADTIGEGNHMMEFSPCGIEYHGGSKSGENLDTWIWIMDTGIDVDHPELNVINEAPYATTFYGDDWEDRRGHGTHVAGIAAAKKNGIGIVGVSAGASVVPVKVLNDAGVGPWSTIISGLDHIAGYDIPGDVLNLSLGGSDTYFCNGNNPMRTAINNISDDGTWVIIASGNEGYNNQYTAPGCIDGTRVLTIGNIDCNDQWNSTSNYGTSVDFVAVGTNVLSTFIDGGYAVLTGTSMAAPHVAGLVHQSNARPTVKGYVARTNTDKYRIANK